MKTFVGEVAGAANALPDGSQFLNLRETDIESNLIANSLKFNYGEIIFETEQTLMREHGPEWKAKVGYAEMKRIHEEAELRAIQATVMDTDSGFLELLNDPKARQRLLGSPIGRDFLRKGLGDAELARYDAMNEDTRAASDAAVLKAAEEY